MTTVLESLKYADDDVHGGNPQDEGIANEWIDYGFATGESCEAWWAAGCWEPSTAGSLRDAGYDPANDSLRYRTGRESAYTDAMYALCDCDISMADVTW